MLELDNLLALVWFISGDHERALAKSEEVIFKSQSQPDDELWIQEIFAAMGR